MMNKDENSEFDFSASGPEQTVSRNPLSLALMFYIVTMGGIVSACLSFLAGSQESLTFWRLFGVLGVGSVVGLFLGTLIGIFYLRRLLAAFVGLAVGAIIGVVAGALTLINPDQFIQAAFICFAGCWLLVVAILLAARFQGETKEAAVLQVDQSPIQEP